MRGGRWGSWSVVLALWASGSVAGQAPSPPAARPVAETATAEVGPPVPAPLGPPNEPLQHWLDATSWVASLKSLPWAGTVWLHSDGFPGHPGSQLTGPDLECGPMPSRAYLEADYLLWWIKESKSPPLLTIGSLQDDMPGALNQPGTVVVFGGDVQHEERSGGRFTAGYWLTPDQALGVEGSYFFLDQRSVVFRAASDPNGSPLLARPFFDVTPGTAGRRPGMNINPGVEDADPVSIPDQLAGSIAFTFRSRLFGAEANARWHALQGEWYRVDLLGGFRFMELDEHFGVGEVLDELPLGTGSHVAIMDDFNARTRFYGGQIGSRCELRYGRWVVDLKSKVAFGRSDENVFIQGVTRLTDTSGTTRVFPAGLLALPTNNGVYNRNRFAVMPEGNVNLNYELTDHVRLHFGYGIVYISEVVRPADQIDRTVNANQLPSAAGAGTVGRPFRPTFTFNGTDFWAQGLNFGLEFSF